MTYTVLLAGVLALLLGLALLTVITDKLFTAVIYAGALSTVAAFCYVLLGAPDVALAEVVIGSTLSTVVFLVTLKKYKLFTIYIRPGEGLAKVLSALEHALQQRDMEPHVLQSAEPAAVLLARPDCDLVIERDGARIIIHGEESSQYIQQFKQELSQEDFPEIVIQDSLPDSVGTYREEKQ